MRLEQDVTEEEAFETSLMNFINKRYRRIKADELTKLMQSSTYEYMKKYFDENKLFSSISMEVIRIKNNVASLLVSLLGERGTENFYDIRKGDWFIRDIVHDDVLYQEVSLVTNVRMVSGIPAIISSRIVIEASSITIPMGSNHHLSEVHPICFNTSMVNVFPSIDNISKYTRLGARLIGVKAGQGALGVWLTSLSKFASNILVISDEVAKSEVEDYFETDGVLIELMPQLGINKEQFEESINRFGVVLIRPKINFHTYDVITVKDCIQMIMRWSQNGFLGFSDWEFPGLY